MGYMSVEEHTNSRLRLLREPTFLSKAIFVGFLIGTLGVFIYGSECFCFKVLIGLGAICLSYFIVDNYEICEFDKATSEVRLTRLHWCQYLLGSLHFLRSPPYVTAKLEDIQDVRVEEQGGSNSGYQVILSLAAGIQLGVTEVFTTEDRSEHEGIAKIIRSFLADLSPLKSDAEADDEENDGSSTDDDFEQISRTDLEGLETGEDGKVLEPAAASAAASGDATIAAAGDIGKPPIEEENEEKEKEKEVLEAGKPEEPTS